jgi:hypothetical protein
MSADQPLKPLHRPDLDGNISHLFPLYKYISSSKTWSPPKNEQGLPTSTPQQPFCQSFTSNISANGVSSYHEWPQPHPIPMQLHVHVRLSMRAVDSDALHAVSLHDSQQLALLVY